MWILKFLPDWIFYLILLAGVAGIAASFVLKFIPFVAQYRLPIQLVAGIVTAFGLYMVGAISNNNAWLARVSDLEKKVAIAEAKSAEANTQLVDALAKSKEKIVAAQVANKQAIQQNAVVINRECKLNDISVQLYNQAVKGGAK